MTLTVKKWALVGKAWLGGPRFFRPFNALFDTRSEAREYARHTVVRDTRGFIPVKPVRVRITMTTEDGAK